MWLFATSLDSMACRCVGPSSILRFPRGRAIIDLTLWHGPSWSGVWLCSCATAEYRRHVANLCSSSDFPGRKRHWKALLRPLVGRGEAGGGVAEFAECPCGRNDGMQCNIEKRHSCVFVMAIRGTGNRSEAHHGCQCADSVWRWLFEDGKQGAAARRRRGRKGDACEKRRWRRA